MCSISDSLSHPVSDLYQVHHVTYNIKYDSIEEVTALFPVHRIGEEVDEGCVIAHSDKPLVLGAPSKMHVLVERSWRKRDVLR